MINVFKRLAPAYGRVLRKFALDVWYGRADKKDFISAADRFRRRYTQELAAHYRKLGFPIRPGQIRDQADEWLADQITLADRVQAVADEKKSGLLEDFDLLRDRKREEVQSLITGIKPEGRVSPVVSFSHNFEDRAIQMGEDAAFDLATEINHSVVHNMSDIYRWTTQHDNRVRKTHQKLSEKLFSYIDPPTTIEGGHTHTGNPGTDWGCVPSGTRIRLNSDVIRCFRRRFHGEISSLVTESGITLTATGNHPILTLSGWKPANLIEIGDYVLKVPDKRLNGSESDVYDTGVTVEKIFDFFSLCGIRESVPGGGTQFHGDGIPEEEIDIVTLNWKLTDILDPCSGQFIRELIFSDPNVMAGHLLGASESELDTLLRWLGLSSFGNIRGGSNLFSLFGRGILEADEIGLRAIARSYASVSHKAFNESSHGDITKEFNGAGDAACSAPIFGNDLLMERVVRIERKSFDGHVFNVETSTGWYTANGLSTHNCRCYEMPAQGRPLKSYVVRA